LETAESQRLLAERYESVNNQEAALEAYRQSATYFSREDRASSATKMQLKVAQCSALLKRYRDAIQIFEADAKQSLESHGSAAKMHLLNAGICALATNDLTLVHTKLH
jgi:alpha-soluble NSF attachment protein